MTVWFGSLPLHRKLIVMALAVSSSALVAAMIGLIAFDVARFRSAAVDDAQALGQVIAENASAAILFNDADAARQMLASVAVRPFVSRACMYRADGTLLAGYQRAGSAAACPDVPAEQQGWSAVASRVPVTRNGRVVGAVFVERLLSDLPGRVLATTGAGLLMLLLAGAIAFAVARRLQEAISRPIVSLANAARAIARDQRTEMPRIDAPPDETGALVEAFRDMVQRLVSSNEALKLEVDERRRVEAEREALLSREREANRLKDEFLATVSHELRTPLNAILGWTQILASMKPDERSEQVLGKAVASLARNAQAQSRVIEDLLDISRIVAGKLQLNLTPVDLRTVVESAIEVVTPAASARQVRIEADLPRSASMVQGDFDRIRQALWNILSNAIKFTTPGGTVTVSVSDEGAVYAIRVTDTGIGIAREFLPHVFERFRQADGSTTREHGGLGLGLALVKEIIELHGGSVSAESLGLGKGSTFLLRLPPLMPAEDDAPAVAPAAALPRLDGVDILAVDDNTDALDIVTTALSNVGARVRVAASGADAIGQLRQAPPKIVLCDLAMPAMDGFAVLEAIRLEDGVHGRLTPVLAVTAYASEEYRERCLRAGFQGRIVKPFKTAELVREVAAALGRARPV